MSVSDPNGMHVVIAGERWFKFSANYQHDGRTYAFEFFARSPEEAIETLRSIRTTAIDCHQISMQIPAFPGAGLFARMYCAVRNLFTP